MNMKNKNQSEFFFKVAETVLMPFAFVVRLQVALIRRVLFAAFWVDCFIAKRNIALEWKKESWFPRLKFEIRG
jgi:hypothetical protein